MRDRQSGEPSQSFLVRNIGGGAQAPTGQQPTPQLRQAPAGRLEAIRNSANRHSVGLVESAGNALGNLNLSGAAASNAHTPQGVPQGGFLPTSSSFHQQQQTQNAGANHPITTVAMQLSQQPVQMPVSSQQAAHVAANPLPDVVSSNNLTRNGSAPNLFEQAAAAEHEHQLQMQAQHADRVSANSEESDEMAAASPRTRTRLPVRTRALRRATPRCCRGSREYTLAPRDQRATRAAASCARTRRVLHARNPQVPEAFHE